MWELGGVRVRAVHLPGHTAGHCVLLVEPQGIAFIGDFDLSSFGPYYGDATSSLADFRRSLRTLAELPATGVDHLAPQGRDRRPGAVRRAAAAPSPRRIDEREARLLQMLAAGPQCLDQLVAQRLLYPPEASDLWVGCAEARSIDQHLDELQAAGRVARRRTRPLPAGGRLERARGRGTARRLRPPRPLLFASMACTMAMMAFVAVVGPVARVLGLQPWQAGLTVTVSGALWMLLARVWGAASDRHGRRPVLLFGVAGVCVAYAAMCLAIDGSLRVRPSVAWAFLALVLTRGAVGAFYAAIPAISQALIADHVPPQRRAGAMASLGAASGVGLVLGPAAAAWLSQFSLGAPLYGMAVLPLLAWAVLWRALPREGRPVPRRICRRSAWPMCACAGRWRWRSWPCSRWVSRRSPSASSRSTGSA